MADPAVATREFDSPFGGTTSLEQVFGTFGSVDLVVHRWDIAKGAGVDATIADDDLATVWEFTGDKEDMIRGSGAFGPAVDVGEDASEQERVLAFLGRRA